jgi:hypothetical protein
LGRDRVNVAKRIIQAEGRQIALSSGIIAATQFPDREIPFERGSLARLDSGKWLIPYPNKHEMFGFVLGGQAGTVVSLLDPSDPEQAGWNAEMEKLLIQFAIPFIMRPLAANNLARADDLAREIQSMPQPVTVIVSQTPMEDGKRRPKTQSAIAFMRAYARIAPNSYAAKPSWRLNQAAKTESISAAKMRTRG